MKKELLKKIIETKSKITVLADESTSVGHKSTLIVFLKASVDGDMEPIAFPLDLVELDRGLEKCSVLAGELLHGGQSLQSYPALAQHFREASEDDTRDSRERAKFKGLLSKLCSINFLKSLALMADVLTELKNLSEILQNRKTTLPKAHDIMTTYVKRIESFNRYPGQHAVDASQAEEVMEFKGEELAANRAQASVAANRKEAYNSLINQMAVLNPDNWDHDNPRFGDNEDTIHQHTTHQDTIHEYTTHQDTIHEYTTHHHTTHQHTTHQDTIHEYTTHHHTTHQDTTHQYIIHQYIIHQYTSHRETTHQHTTHQHTTHQDTTHQHTILQSRVVCGPV
ncbi:hypothetical protein NHX12_024638 [Muraenolepis orangiensis]|uniref:Uncharacterized protein n=1 Tax=Muraenolepis orangiensis TaxID=630683 RepID=A0A9Q0INW8_9TELE|nr:hypothetical protein NHX12_024638 [Muraenolepis orangiensis]